VLTSLGEKLSDDEVEELLKGTNIGKDGSIDYSGISFNIIITYDPEFVRMILAN
jgi:Ca2+-binding EF-hand superfamily protein